MLLLGHYFYLDPLVMLWDMQIYELDIVETGAHHLDVGI